MTDMTDRLKLAAHYIQLLNHMSERSTNPNAVHVPTLTINNIQTLLSDYIALYEEVDRLTEERNTLRAQLEQLSFNQSETKGETHYEL